MELEADSRSNRSVNAEDDPKTCSERKLNRKSEEELPRQ